MSAIVTTGYTVILSEIVSVTVIAIACVIANDRALLSKPL